MSEFIHEGGWGMYPTIAFGLITAAIALWHAVAPAAKRTALIVGFGAATLLSGILGTTVGLQHSVMHIRSLPADDRWIFLIGLRESLNCTVAALVLAMIAALLATYGSYRRARALDRAPEGATAAAVNGA